MTCLLIYLINSTLLFGIEVKNGNKRVSVFLEHEGFYQNTVTSIDKDNENLLWMGSPNGLISFDGYDFEYFYAQKDSFSLPSSRIENIFVDHNNLIWISTKEGLCFYDKASGHFTTLNQNPDKAFLVMTADNVLWSASGNSLNYYTLNKDNIVEDEGVINVFDLPQKPLKHINFWEEGLLVGNENKLVWINPKGNIKKEINIKDTFENVEIYTAKVIDKFLWLGTSNGLFKCVIDNDFVLFKVKHYPLDTLVNKGRRVKVNTISTDDSGHIWIGTRLSGLFKLETKNETLRVYSTASTERSQLSSDIIYSICEDKDNVIWAGTGQGGLNKIDLNEKPFFSYTHNPLRKNTLMGRSTNYLAEDSKGYVWVSFHNKKMSRSTAPVNDSNIHSLSFEEVNLNNPLFSKQSITLIEEDSKGYIWFGTNLGYWVYSPISKKVKKIDFTYQGKKVKNSTSRILKQISDNHLLLGSKDLLILENPWAEIETKNTIEIASNLLPLDGASAETCIKDKNDTYWLGTKKGLITFSIFNHQKITINQNQMKQIPKHIRHCEVLSLHHQDNVIWVGLFGEGLERLELNAEGNIVNSATYDRSNGLPDNMVYGIVGGGKSGIWLSTDAGICQFNLAENKFYTYGNNDGINSRNFRKASFNKTKEGLILFGSFNGITLFNPLQILKNPILPRASVNDIWINGKEIQSVSEIERTISFTEDGNERFEELMLTPESKNIAFELVAHHNANPENNAISYKLLGFDQEWKTTSKGKYIVNYTNLPAGDYKLQIKAKNGDNVWSEIQELVAFTIPLPIYLRWWSILLITCVLGVLIYVIANYYYKIHSLKREIKNKEFETERIREVDQAKLKFFTNISHEFKTPLSLIIAPLEKLIEENKNEENAKLISIINSNINRLHRLIDNIINYRKVENQKIKINYSRSTIGEFVSGIYASFQNITEDKGINFTFSVENENNQVSIDKEKTEFIVFNLLSNAIKHTNKGGMIQLVCKFIEQKGNKLLSISVIDNGIGIQPEDIDHIFDRFYTVERNGEMQEGTGIGLDFSKSLVEKMKGEIKVESRPNVETTFEVLLPYDNEETVTGVIEEEETQLPVVEMLNPLTVKEEIIQKDASLPSIVIIDDEADIRQFLQHSFESKYNVETAINGETGLDIVNKTLPDLVICDVMMDGIDGFEVCKKIKETPATCYIPVILLTALNSDEKKLEGIELGADHYMNKPFSIVQLEAIAKRLIQNGQKVQEHYALKSNLPDQNVKLLASDKTFILEINNIIEEELSNSSFGVKELAKKAGYSSAQFYRKIKNITGHPPNVLIRNYRLQKAARILLENPKMTAIEVMYKIGIDSPAYFSTSFKKVFNCSPGAYRNYHEKQLKKQQALKEANPNI
ncbi:hybrid sensor histidine kinase/response regulator transcription factor [Flammeovirga sp. EKP202]|uniref:hybrid sensor histidine kinase/response regulator transcription factor n=1 Tax=Flammeovirga sp. EKP202 TaxID=2770592 RepID=UPI00165F0B8D|nr:hybrid sensor histidine kinase/response regulator transcription factor [Flammeovirga sp. EKP202]MBD0400612.1 response regulator [Flammeovirga sp. EKP202]